MATAVFANTVATALLAHTQLTSGLISVGAEVNVDTKLSALISVAMGRTVATALTNEVVFKLQVKMADTATDAWRTIYEFSSNTGKTAASSTTLNGATSAGATTLVVTSATGLAKGDRLYLRETGTPANSEWCEIRDISGTTVTPLNALERAHTNGINIADLAELFQPWREDLAGVEKIRLIADGGTNTSGQTVDVIAVMNTLDSVTS